MVTIQSFARRQAKDGRDFISLELIGGVELVQSITTGQYYATVRKCSIPASFGEEVAAAMVGSRLPGKIIRVETEAYNYTVPSTGEVIKLKHSYAYQPEEGAEVVTPNRQRILV